MRVGGKRKKGKVGGRTPSIEKRYGKDPGGRGLDDNIRGSINIGFFGRERNGKAKSVKKGKNGRGERGTKRNSQKQGGKGRNFRSQIKTTPKTGEVTKVWQRKEVGYMRRSDNEHRPIMGDPTSLGLRQKRVSPPATKKRRKELRDSWRKNKPKQAGGKKESCLENGEEFRKKKRAWRGGGNRRGGHY